MLLSSAGPSNKAEPVAAPVSTTAEPAAAAQAFDALEATLSTPAKTKYRHRMEENYDLDGSPTFTAWKKLYCSSQQSKSADSTNEASGPNLSGNITVSQQIAQTTEPTSTTSNQSNTSAAVLREILTYPTLERTGPPKRKNLKRTIPNFVSGPESMQLLLDEKLKKARQMAEKQKKMREMEAKKEEKRKRMEVN